METVGQMHIENKATEASIRQDCEWNKRHKKRRLLFGVSGYHTENCGVAQHKNPGPIFM